MEKKKEGMEKEHTRFQNLEVLVKGGVVLLRFLGIRLQVGIGHG